jgi:hypothetical protein
MAAAGSSAADELQLQLQLQLQLRAFGQPQMHADERGFRYPGMAHRSTSGIFG